MKGLALSTLNPHGRCLFWLVPLSWGGYTLLVRLHLRSRLLSATRRLSKSLSRVPRTFSMQQSYCFINGTDVDKSTRKRMRRHVMIGKNAGKTIQRKSRRDSSQCRGKKAPTVSAVTLGPRPHRDYYPCMDCGKPDSWSICNHVLCGLDFPVKLTPHFAEVITNCMFAI